MGYRTSMVAGLVVSTGGETSDELEEMGF